MNGMARTLYVRFVGAGFLAYATVACVAAETAKQQLEKAAGSS
jgi:hypothetical protein